MNVLVAYGSKRGSTREIAEAIGEELRASGCTAVVRAADSVLDLDGFGAVVLGGALYMGRWHPDARHFVRRHAAELRDRPGTTADAYLAARGALVRMVDPAAMGRFRVLAFGRGLPESPGLRGLSFRLGR